MKKKYLEHQTLGRRVIHPGDPAYYIVDCWIFISPYFAFQDTYYYLLRRYLETVCSGCEPRRVYLNLIGKLQDLHHLNETHIQVKSFVKFTYSEKATKFLKITHFGLSTLEFLSNFELFQFINDHSHSQKESLS